MLKIKNLKVGIEDKEILKGIDLEINPGEVHVIMGPNGSGKSTLINTIMGNPKYEITGGSIEFEGKDITTLSTDQRARLGMFVSFQNPEEIPGVTVENFLRAAKMAQSDEEISVLKFKKELKNEMDDLEMDSSYGDRYLNVGFSGGEKKKNEILQMKVLDPKFIMLDETDSGLDVDATKIVSKEVKSFLNDEKSVLIITHHNQILENLRPDFVHVMVNGEVVESGGERLVDEIETDGYKRFRG